MEYRIKLADRFNSIFGVAAGNALPLLGDIGLSRGGLYKDIKPDPEFNAKGKSPLGNPLFDVIEFKHEDLPYDEESGENVFKFEYPFHLRRMQVEKRTSSTIVNEHAEGGIPAGEVVESFGVGPWSLEIVAILVDEDSHHFPLDKIIALNRLIKVNDVLRVYSRVLDALDITQCYVSGRIGYRDTEFPDTVIANIPIKSHVPVEALILN